MLSRVLIFYKTEELFLTRYFFMQHQVVDIFCTPTGNVVNVLKINVHHFFVSHDFLTVVICWFVVFGADKKNKMAVTIEFSLTPMRYYTNSLTYNPMGHYTNSLTYNPMGHYANSLTYDPMGHYTNSLTYNPMEHYTNSLTYSPMGHYTNSLT